MSSKIGALYEICRVTNIDSLLFAGGGSPGVGRALPANLRDRHPRRSVDAEGAQLRAGQLICLDELA